jgi:hypothetical protein
MLSTRECYLCRLLLSIPFETHLILLKTSRYEELFYKQTFSPSYEYISINKIKEDEGSTG